MDRFLNIDTALQELAITVPRLLSIAVPQHSQTITCQRTWNPQAKTYTYHTHVAVPEVSAAALQTVSDLFFNAYRLQQHGWYSQFVRGEMYPLPNATTVGGEHQIGQGLFDFGVPALRCYHTLFSRVIPDTHTHVVALRTVNEPMPRMQGAKKVFLLPPSGDVFRLIDSTLHWHHICTTTGIQLLPGSLDRLLMNALRRFNLDRKERQTYLTEAEGFRQFVQTMDDNQSGDQGETDESMLLANN